MGTYASISLPKEDAHLANLAFERLNNVEMSLSSYDENAEIYILNHNREVFLSSDTYEALKLSSEYYKETNSYFDISVGSITKGLFHFGENEILPKEKELQRAKIDFNGLHFDKTKAWLEEGTVIDLGGMGKGFGVDKAVEILKEQGVKESVVSLSGDIYCISVCSMSVQNPFAETVLASFSMKDSAISTSGNYRRFVQSKDNNHLIDPKKKKPQKTFASVTLISDKLSNSTLDAYATAVSVMPYSKAMTFLNGNKEIGYLIVKTDKKVYMNENFKILTKDLRLYKPLETEKIQYIKVLP